MIDYAEFQSAIGLNWYDIDSNLQSLMRRVPWPVSRRLLQPATLGRETLWARLRIPCC